MDKTLESLPRKDIAEDTSVDTATRSSLMTLLVAAVVMVIVFTALWIEQLIAPLGAMGVLF